MNIKNIKRQSLLYEFPWAPVFTKMLSSHLSHWPWSAKIFCDLDPPPCIHDHHQLGQTLSWVRRQAYVETASARGKRVL